MQRASIVLCGGKSSRMGRDKAFLPIDGQPMLARIAGVVNSVVDRVVVVSADGQALPSLPPNVEIVRDDVPDWGPLAGLAMGLRSLRGADTAFVASCDVPFLQAAFVRFLFDAIGDAQAAIPFVEDRWHPLVAVYRVDVLERVEELLRLGRRRMLDVCDVLTVRRVEASELMRHDPGMRSLVNINTKEDYTAIEKDVPRP